MLVVVDVVPGVTVAVVDEVQMVVVLHGGMPAAGVVDVHVPGVRDVDRVVAADVGIVDVAFVDVVDVPVVEEVDVVVVRHRRVAAVPIVGVGMPVVRAMGGRVNHRYLRRHGSPIHSAAQTGGRCAA